MFLTFLLLYIVVILGIIVLYLIHNRFNYWKRRGITSETPHLIYGNMQGVKTKYHELDIYKAFYAKHKTKDPFVGFYFFQQPMAFVTDLQLIKNILIKDFSNFTDRPAYYNEEADPMSAYLFNLDNPKWRNYRQKLSPTFTSGKMKIMFSQMVQIGHKFVEAMDKSVDQQSSSIDMKDMFARYTTDLIGMSNFGLEFDSLTDTNEQFLVHGRRFLSNFSNASWKVSFGIEYPNIARTFGMTAVEPSISKFFMNAIKDTVAHRELNKNRRNDLIDLLIDQKNRKVNNMSLDQISTQAFSFYLAGFETSASTGSFALYELALNQTVQNKAREEVKRVLAKHNNEYTYDSVHEMHYLEQTIAETLRLYPIVPALFRRANNDYLALDNSKYKIEKGVNCLIPVAAIHMDPEIYKNPTEFNPDNFSPEMMQQRDSMTWLAFGDGPRNCIGMRFGKLQSRLGVAMLLEKFKFSIAAETEIPIKFDNTNLLIASKNGVYLKVERI